LTKSHPRGKENYVPEPEKKREGKFLTKKKHGDAGFASKWPKNTK